MLDYKIYLHLLRGVTLCLLLIGIGGVAPNYAIANNLVEDSSVSTTLVQQQLEKKISISLERSTVRQVLYKIQQESDITIAILNDEIDKLPRIDFSVSNLEVRKVLDRLLNDTPYIYKSSGTGVAISKRSEIPTQAQPQDTKITVNGKIVDEDGKPIIGATVMVVGTSAGAITDDTGGFTITTELGSKIEVSFVGMLTKIVEVTRREGVLTIEMEKDVEAMDDVTVVGGGYFSKTRYSSTSSHVKVQGEDLRKVGSLNMLTAISVFDPSVRTVPNDSYGSDPNRVPEITIRGENGIDLRTSADDSRTNPNSPMYILDGLEVSAERVYDLDMNRIEQFYILKDAAATSLYGSRGANGVIVIETKRPKAGEVKITVNANYNVSVPDLRDYNLMNAEEKLEYERLAGVYVAGWLVGSTQDELDFEYNEKLKEIERGVDTYWLSQPLRTSINQRYNMFIEGGDNSFRYGIDLKYDNDKGVMIGSGREKVGATFNFNYNIGRKFYIINDLTVNDVVAENSPYGSFANFAEQNPYERMYDSETGDMVRRFDYNNEVNPMVNAILPNTDFDRYTEIQNNLNLDWRISPKFRVNGRLGITKKLANSELYRSPFSTEFDTVIDSEDKGSYTSSKENSLNLDGTLTGSYNTIFKNDISLSVGVGSNFTTSSINGDGYTVTGFLNDNLNFPEFAQQYKENSKPTGVYDESKMIGFFTNVNVGYANRYFVDASFRTDGSSRFGKDSRFAPFWSVGAAWNLDREKWWKGDGYMKLRGSVGSMGSVNFSASQAITQYYYSSDYEYNGYYGAILSGYGNPALRWQNTLQYNLGLDMSILTNLITLNVDAYIKETQNLLLPIDVAPSTGFSSYTENMGSVENKGIDARLRFNLIQDNTRDLFWNVTLAVSSNKNKIKNLSNALQAINQEATENATQSEVVRQYQVGYSQSALWVVQSMGIDPATGNEIYVKKNGDLTFTYDAADKIQVGDTNPSLQGSFQSNLTYRGFNLYCVFAYEFGAEIYNSTLASKVEGASPSYNADKRVLYDRWTEPGDVAMFRRIDDTSTTYPTTRLVQKNDFFRLQSLSLSYDVPTEYLKNTFIERCKFTINATDLFRISTVKIERGTIYPYAQTITGGVNITF